MPSPPLRVPDVVRTRIKICGVTSPRDAIFALDCGADAIGLNFYAKSPRYVTDDRAEAIIRELPPLGATVGVFVETPDAAVFAAARRFGLHAVQTYSNVPPDLPFFPIAHIPAFRVKAPTDLDAIREFVQQARLANRTPAAVLVDSFVAGEMGGTGHRAPWELLADFLFGVPVILAGGLTPENVAEAIRIVQPWGVDVASGVEAAPGRKDPGKVRAFMQAVRAADVASSSIS